jgi:hypothetical protein
MIEEDALLTIQSDEDGFLGSNGSWFSDLDGDGMDDLILIEPNAQGEGINSGQAAIFFSPTLQGESIAVNSADILLSGNEDNAYLSAVIQAEDKQYGRSFLLFSQMVSTPGQQAVFRIPIEDLATGNVADIADGGIATWVTNTTIFVSNLGETSVTGSDQLIDYFGESFDIRQLEGTVNQGSGRWSATADNGEWLTGFVALGDTDGGGRSDIAFLADDWPAGQAQGRVGMLYGETIQDGFEQNIDQLSYLATGSSLYDSFGYSLIPVGDFDGDGHSDAAVSAYGADLSGTSAGSVILLPLP